MSTSDRADSHVDGAFSGTAVSQAAFTFIYRFMANKSAEYPEGILNKAVLKSFMAIEGPEDNVCLCHMNAKDIPLKLSQLTWNPGHERIPDNWYKRNAADEYSIAYCKCDP